MASIVAQNTYSNNQMRYVPGQQHQTSQNSSSSQAYPSSQFPTNKLPHGNGNESKLSLTPTTTASSGSSPSSPNYLSESIENYSAVNNTNNSVNSNGSNYLSNGQQNQQPHLNQQPYSTNKTENNWSADKKGIF